MPFERLLPARTANARTTTSNAALPPRHLKRPPPTSYARPFCPLQTLPPLPRTSCPSPPPAPPHRRMPPGNRRWESQAVALLRTLRLLSVIAPPSPLPTLKTRLSSVTPSIAQCRVSALSSPPSTPRPVFATSAPGLHDADLAHSARKHGHALGKADFAGHRVAPRSLRPHLPSTLRSLRASPPLYRTRLAAGLDAQLATSARYVDFEFRSSTPRANTTPISPRRHRAIPAEAELPSSTPTSVTRRRGWEADTDLSRTTPGTRAEWRAP
ncbi:hypothetical protein K438DRAFT_1997238 [Mycena galopus ATCC 62051]|nr:hypothetical protein K438DRAFT_1997238 [Mycena galopus ATCC 62051]